MRATLVLHERQAEGSLQLRLFAAALVIVRVKRKITSVEGRRSGDARCSGAECGRTRRQCGGAATGRARGRGTEASLALTAGRRCVAFVRQSDRTREFGLLGLVWSALGIRSPRPRLGLLGLVWSALGSIRSADANRPARACAANA